MNTFLSMNLSPETHKALNHLKFTEPTQVQRAVIPKVFDGKDVIICAQTGSGKTGAFGIPLVEQLLANPDQKGLVLAPTRELAQQIVVFLNELVKTNKELNISVLVGGTDIRKQFNALKKNPRLIVATPGRLTDHLKRKTLSLKNLKYLVLDEGDRMLDMGFAPQLDYLLKFIPEDRQTSLFTATFPLKIKNLAKKYLNNPEHITVGKNSQPVEKIKQSVISISQDLKEDKLIDELNQRTGSVIVFTKTQIRTHKLAQSLKQIGFKVEQVHGGRTQGQRNQALKRFRDGSSRILCATDVAARGLDVPHVQHVINFDLPMVDEDYVHRIGRTARNGAEGEALSFVSNSERRTWQILVRKFKLKNVDLPHEPKKDRGGKKKSKKKFNDSKDHSDGRRKKFSKSLDNSEGRRKKFSESQDSSEGRGKKFSKSQDNSEGRGKKFSKSQDNSEGRGKKFSKSQDSSEGRGKKKSKKNFSGKKRSSCAKGCSLKPRGKKSTKSKKRR